MICCVIVLFYIHRCHTNKTTSAHLMFGKCLMVYSTREMLRRVFFHSFIRLHRNILCLSQLNDCRRDQSTVFKCMRCPLPNHHEKMVSVSHGEISFLFTVVSRYKILLHLYKMCSVIHNSIILLLLVLLLFIII